MVSAQDVISLYQRLAAVDIQIWLTGGWGIDALLGKETRPHKDLDVVMLLDDMVRMQELLRHDGFRLKELWSENLWTTDAQGNKTATALVLQDEAGRQFDAHAMRLDKDGNGVPAWDEADGFVFTRQDLAGIGTIAGFAVQCITPEMQMRCHTGYELCEKHQRDLELLNKRFGVEFPEAYFGTGST